MYILLPFVIVSALLGFIAIASCASSALIPPRSSLVAAVRGAEFVVYRNAVVTYATNNPSFVGSVPVSALVLPSGFAGLPGAGNQIVATASGLGRVITVWAALPAGAAGQALAATRGDLSYGLVSGNVWVSPLAGSMGALAVSVPDGAVVSVYQTGT